MFKNSYFQESVVMNITTLTDPLSHYKCHKKETVVEHAIWTTTAEQLLLNPPGYDVPSRYDKL
jgi:hypothetical protein